MLKHQLIDDTLIVERDERGKVKGIVARCTCGWVSRPHFSSMAASVSFRVHQEQAEREQQKAQDHEL